MKARGGLEQKLLEAYIADMIRPDRPSDSPFSDIISITSKLNSEMFYNRFQSADMKQIASFSGDRPSHSRQLSRNFNRSRQSVTSRMTTRAAFMASQAARKKSVLASLPVNAIKDAVDVCKDGQRGLKMASGEIVDPYPARGATGQADSIHPLPQFLFTWLMRRMSILRPNRLAHSLLLKPPQAIHADVKKPHSRSKSRRMSTKDIFSEGGDDLTLGFDRFHCEKVLQLGSGASTNLVIITILQGILKDFSLLSDDENGVPKCAIRYCPVKELINLLPGLTVLAYDFNSKMSRVTLLNEKSMDKISQHFGCSSDNCPHVATKIMENAESCLQINRVAGIFTGISFNFSILKKVAADKTIAEEAINVDNLNRRNELRIGDKFAINRNDIFRRMRNIERNFS